MGTATSTAPTTTRPAGAAAVAVTAATLGINSAPAVQTRDIYTPSRLNSEARILLERGFLSLWLEGEISNLSRPSSGHWYFSLKDDAAQLRSAMFRQRNVLAGFQPKDGMHVLVRGRVSLYEARGDYQFLVDYMEPAGEGALRLKFEALKAKLAAAGLFAAERKKAFPRLPRRIGIVTSPTGAAVRDVLNILRRRFPLIPVLIYPVPVQGAVAAAQVAKAIRYASQSGHCDVLIVARGGGSLEDLWAFNEEVVAYAIAECLIPVITGVGHEVDFTIADFVADLRAPTPSGAAELVVPDWQTWHRELLAHEMRLLRSMRSIITRQAQTFSWLRQRLGQLHPGIGLRQKIQRCDELEQRLQRALLHRIHRARSQLAANTARLREVSPAARLLHGRARFEQVQARLSPAIQTRLREERVRLQTTELRLAPTVQKNIARLQQQLGGLGRTLNAVSPLATLDRGYAIVTDDQGHVVTRAEQLQPGDVLKARLAQGNIEAQVRSIDHDDKRNGDPPN